MSMTFETGFRTTLASKLNSTDVTAVLATAPTVTKGRMFLRSGTQKGWINFTGVSSTTLTGVTWVAQTGDNLPTGSGQNFIAGTEVVLVAMHDQLLDRQNPIPRTYATTAARDTALGADGAATEAYVNIYVTATGLHYNYNLSTNQWESIETGTTTPNASTTVAGKVEEATSAQSIAGTQTGETGAELFDNPLDIAKNNQSSCHTYTSATDLSDTYTANLTPALTAYSTGMKIRVKFTTANTGACTININSLGAKDIKTRGGNNPASGDIAALSIRELIYDGTNFVLDYNTATSGEPGSVEMATDGEVDTGTDETRYTNSKQVTDKAHKTINISVGELAYGSLTIGYDGVSLPAAGTSPVYAGFIVSGGYVGISSITLHTTAGGTNSGDVNITTSLVRNRVATNEQTDSDATRNYTYAGTITQGLDITINGAAYNGITLQNGDWVGITIQRNGDNAGDTYTGNVLLHTITIVLTY